jgi:hypothetical protein
MEKNPYLSFNDCLGAWDYNIKKYDNELERMWKETTVV